MTAILERAGSRSIVLPDGKKIAGKRWLAFAFWELVTTGAVTLPSGKKLEVEPKDWIETGKWLYKHIDGDALARHEVTGAEGKPLLDIESLMRGWQERIAKVESYSE